MSGLELTQAFTHKSELCFLSYPEQGDEAEEEEDANATGAKAAWVCAKPIEYCREIKTYQVGQTRVYFAAGVLERLEVLRLEAVAVAAKKVQAQVCMANFPLIFCNKRTGLPTKPTVDEHGNSSLCPLPV